MKQILFLGNSFTFFNDLPGMLQTIAEKEGYNWITEHVTKGGAYLTQFVDPEHKLHDCLLKKYAERDWDTVILQDQSALPALSPSEHIDAVKSLCEVLNLEKKTVLLYQTWPYRDDTDKLRSVNMDYEEMREKLELAYDAAAKEVGGIRVPVGNAFPLACKKGISPYKPDDYHPNVEGTYLAACLFFRVLAGHLPKIDSRPDDITKETASALLACADAV